MSWRAKVKRKNSLCKCDTFLVLVDFKSYLSKVIWDFSLHPSPQRSKHHRVFVVGKQSSFSSLPCSTDFLFLLSKMTCFDQLQVFSSTTKLWRSKASTDISFSTLHNCEKSSICPRKLRWRASFSTDWSMSVISCFIQQLTILELPLSIRWSPLPAGRSALKWWTMNLTWLSCSP